MFTSENLQKLSKHEFLVTVASQVGSEGELKQEDFDILSSDFEYYNRLFEGHVLFKQ
jgi:hypothetical protein